MGTELTQAQVKHRQKMAMLEDSIRMQNRGDTLDPIHHFGHRTYVRELFIPAGATLTGKIHRYSCINIVSLGEITVATEDGQKRFKAPSVVISKPGTKRAGFAHVDTIWITIHHSDQTDPELVEDEVIVQDYIELDYDGPVYPCAGLTGTEVQVLKSLLSKTLQSDEKAVKLLEQLNVS